MAAANAPAMLKLFMDTFGLALPPNPTWLSKLKAVIARRGVEVVTKALHNATYSERWIKFMQNADDAMQVFVKDSNIDNLIDLKLKKDKPKPKAINLPGRKTDNLDHIKVNTI